MNVKQRIACQYCAAQGFTTFAVVQQQKAQKPEDTRYGCDNGHFFAVPTKTVLAKAAA